MDAGHPDRNTFERFSRGEATAAEERWIEEHLRSACARCQRHVDELLTCAYAPGGLDPGALDGAGPDRTDAQDESWDRLFARLGSRLSGAAAERSEAPALLAELWNQPWDEQSILLRLDRRLRTVAVCELLIEKSFEEGFRDTARAIELAERGLLLAELLDADRYGRSVVQDLQAVLERSPSAWRYD